MTETTIGQASVLLAPSTCTDWSSNTGAILDLWHWPDTLYKTALFDLSTYCGVWQSKPKVHVRLLVRMSDNRVERGRCLIQEGFWPGWKVGAMVLIKWPPMKLSTS